MWRSFFFAVGIILIFIGLQCLVVEEFRVDKNSRVFAVASKANRAFDSSFVGTSALKTNSTRLAIKQPI